MKLLKIIIILSAIFIYNNISAAELIDRVVAFVDDDVITLRELDNQYENLHSKDNTVTKEMTLNTMVNQLLIEKDAVRRRITGTTKEDTINKYINLYVKSQIFIKDKDIDYYYNENINNLKGQNIKDIRDKINEILTEKQINVKLWELINNLKNKSYVKIQLDLTN
ncbi:MAG: hypothetical protein HQK91_11120 [Nitrospirae bacterium]|nr:hypothetical protein [Nitrospirota bacterium]